MWQQPRPYPVPGGDRVQHAPRRPGPRLRDLPPRPDGRPDDRLRQPAEGAAPRGAALAPPGRRTGDRDRDERSSYAAEASKRSGKLLFFLVVPGTVAGLIPWLLTGWRSGHALATDPRRGRPAARRRRGGPPPRVSPVRRRRRRHAGADRTHEAPRRRRPLPLRSQPDVPRGRGDDRGTGARTRPARAACVRRGIRRHRLRLRTTVRGAHAAPAVRRAVRGVPARGAGLVASAPSLAAS